MTDVAELQALVARQRKELSDLHRAAERRNRQLDALGLVWCDGGCELGMCRHRADASVEAMPIVTAGHVADLQRNAQRAVRWYLARAAKAASDAGQDPAAARERAMVELASAAQEPTG